MDLSITEPLTSALQKKKNEKGEKEKKPSSRT